jgi:hypothetical protein
MTKVKKNNNLENYRTKQTQINKNLILKAIKHIRSLNGDINFSLVSQVTYDIANIEDGEKGISLAGISKSKVYRPLIEEAILANNKSDNKLISNTNTKISVGDIQLKTHALRIQNINLKKENKILKSTLQDIKLPKQEVGNINENILKQYENILDICSSLTSRLLELELAYIDIESSTLNVSMYGDVLVPKESLELYYKEKLDEIKSKY